MFKTKLLNEVIKSSLKVVFVMFYHIINQIILRKVYIQ